MTRVRESPGGGQPADASGPVPERGAGAMTVLDPHAGRIGAQGIGRPRAFPGASAWFECTARTA